jgi:dTDP-4-dehydrorhamnose 3,5-epimerase
LDRGLEPWLALKIEKEAMIFRETTLKDAWLLDLEPRGDARGFFARTMCKDEFARHNLATDYVQQNMSFSAQKGTLRGMHFQRGAAAEAKLVHCGRGAVVDVIVDIRGASPTYLKHEAFELTAENRRRLYVPPGFAHSFQTLTDDAEVSYLVSSPYTLAAEGGLRWNDPLLGIAWPLDVTNISEKDAAWPLLVAGEPAIF